MKRHDMQIEKNLQIRLYSHLWINLTRGIVYSLLLACIFFPIAVYADGPTFTVGDQILGHGPLLTLGDLDGDDDLDAVVEGGLGHFNASVWLNDGKGQFQDSGQSLGEVQAQAMALGDVDGDGDLDLFLSGCDFECEGYSASIWINNGKGQFQKSDNVLEHISIGEIALGDIDGDGDLDAVLGDDSVSILLNDGNGQFTKSDQILGEPNAVNAIILGDVDGDGDLDAVLGGSQGSSVWLNDGQGHFTNNGQDLKDFTVDAIALGDVDGDGDLDAVTGKSVGYDQYGRTFAVWLNDGKGQFKMSDQVLDGTLSSHAVVALGDVDGDGYLDAVVNNNNYTMLWLNDGKGRFKISDQKFGSGNQAIALGDLDGDGDLDALVNNSTGSYALFNQASPVFVEYGPALDTQKGITQTQISLLGDVDGDGDLDAVLGGLSGPSVWLNDGKGQFKNSDQILGPPDVSAIALGDVDKDGDLDAFLGRDGLGFEVWLNDGKGKFKIGSKGLVGDLGFETFYGDFNIRSVALGDVDGDGDLDALVYAENYTNVWLNDGKGRFKISPQDLYIYGQDTVLGDLDGDGDLDAALRGESGYIALNDGKGRFERTDQHLGNHEGDSRIRAVALGDVDGDDDLDAIVGDDYANSVWLNDGKGQFKVSDQKFRKPKEAFHVTNSIGLADLDGDGDLDAILAGYGNSIWLNDGKGQFVNSGHAVGTDNNLLLPFGDLDGDGTLDTLVPTIHELDRHHYQWLYHVYLNSQGKHNHLQVRLKPTGLTSGVNLYSTAAVIENQHIPVTYTLFHPQGQPISWVEAWYSLNGGGNWKPAIATKDTITHTTNATALTTSPFPTFTITNTHVYTWDTLASGFLGQSDNVVFRIIAHPLPVQTGITNTYHYTNSVPGVLVSGVTTTYRYTNSVPGGFRWPQASATTFPFRVLGTQVRVVDDQGKAKAGAIVYQLTPGTQRKAMPIALDRKREPFRTNGGGYLQGRGTLSTYDELIALWPVTATSGITFTHNYTLYETSAKVTSETLTLQQVQAPGVQVLTVTADNNLLLFNLDVALEWDARKDTQFMSQLQFNLQRTSELLFDWTNGQAALGRVRIFHDAKRNTAVEGFQPWNDSHIRIYATNRMRPSATEGGIISPTLTYTEPILDQDGKPKTLSYGPGQVHIGALWNRYGETSGTLGEDWPRALAHELGHYLFFLEDDYLGVNEQGVLFTIPAQGEPSKSCPSVMNDPYREAQSEFHPQTDWATSGCAKSLAMGRSDWSTIIKFYPPLTAPTESFSEQNQGPSTLPLAVTQLSVISPTEITQPVDVPIFYLIKENGGGTYLPGRNAQAFLFQGDWLTELGQPTLDQVQAWGARPKDRLCIYEATAGYQGCSILTSKDDQVTMRSVRPWQPEIAVTPVTSLTITLSVTVEVGNGKLAARLYPADQAAPSCILLQPAGTKEFTGTFPTLSQPALDGYVHVWLQSETSTCVEPHGEETVDETVTGYAIGGNPVHRRARLALRRADNAQRQTRHAPVVSGDGQVIVFGEALDADAEKEWFFTLQATSVIPNMPPGRSLVGQAYRLTASPNAPSLADTSISFSYLGDQVPTDEERFVHIYFWEQRADACQSQPAPCWRPLTTLVDTEYNVASAKTQGQGLYALMSSIEIPLAGPGWNNFAYTLAYTQPITSALASITGHYTAVWGYDAGKPVSAWQAYSPIGNEIQFEPRINDLNYLQFGRGYWIYMTDTITLYLKSTPDATITDSPNAGYSPPTAYRVPVLAGANPLKPANLPIPPARIFGTVQVDEQQAPANTEVTAWIDGKAYATTYTTITHSLSVYSIDIPNPPDVDPSGLNGKSLMLKVNGVQANEITTWRSGTLIELNLNVKIAAATPTQAAIPVSVPTSSVRCTDYYIVMNGDTLLGSG